MSDDGTVGFIGLGHMGEGMVRRLITHGGSEADLVGGPRRHKFLVWNRSPGKCEVLKAELKGAGRIREHWRGNLHHVDLEPFQERIRSIPTRRGDLTLHCGKLLHEGVAVTSGVRYILVGFVDARSPRVDDTFLASKMANASKRSTSIDYECATRAFVAESEGS